MMKWLLALLALALSILAALVVFTITGVIEPQQRLVRYAHSVEWLEPYFEAYYLGQEALEWRDSEQTAIDQAWLEISQAEQQLDHEREQLERFQRTLDRQQEELHAERQRRVNIDRLALLYSEMRPDEAVAILELMDQELVFQILTRTGNEDASILLARLPPEMAAALSRRFERD